MGRTVKNMTNAKHVRDEINRVYHLVKNKEIEAKQGTTLVYILNSLLNAIRTDVLEERLTELEQIVSNVENK